MRAKKSDSAISPIATWVGPAVTLTPPKNSDFQRSSSSLVSRSRAAKLAMFASPLKLARGLLQRSLEVQPSYVTAYENLGDLYVSMAADAYQRGLKLAPGSAPLQSKLTLARETGARLRSLP